VSALRIRLARVLRVLAERVDWREPECQHPHPGGGVCGFYADSGIHWTAEDCDDARELDGGCPEPSEHHEFARRAPSPRVPGS